MPKIVTKSGKDLTTEQETQVVEMEAAITKWWDKREILGLMKDSYVGGMLERRSPVRPFIPKIA